MNRLPLEQERQLIARCRELCDVIYSLDADEVQAELRATMGIARLDQFKAASDDVAQRLRTAARERDTPLVEGGDGNPEKREFAMVLYAGVMRCFAGTYCKHAQDGGRPLAAVLPARLVSCQTCMPSFLGLILAADLDPGESRLCDFCLQPTATFRQTEVAYGPALLLGDACEACVEAGQAKAVAA